MSAAQQSQARQILQDRCRDIAEIWHKAIAQTSHVPLSSTQVRQRLAELTRETIELLFTPSFERARAEAVGISLARLHYLQPEALGRTQQVLAYQLVRELPAQQALELQPRLAALLGGVAAGFFRQAQETILAEQEQIRTAHIEAIQQTRAALTWEAGVNAAIAELSRALLEWASFDTISSLILESARHLTLSPYGFVGYIDLQTGYLVCPAISSGIWDVREIPDKGKAFVTRDGPRDWMLEGHESLLINEMSDDPHWIGTLGNGAYIRRLLSVPAQLGEMLVGRVTLVNSERDYSEDDRALVKRLADLYALAIQRQRVDERLLDTQDRLVRSERLAAIGELAASVAHELRNPLSVVRSSAYIIKTQLAGADARVLASFERMERQIEAAERIIRDLLEFAQVRLPQLRLSDLNEVVRGALVRVPSTEGFVIETHFAQGLTPVLLDPVQMDRLFLNLITNAVQAMPHGGRLVLSTHQEEEQLSVSVSDTGQGILPDDLPRIFEPLFTTKSQGTGLGLAICRRIVEAHGGRIDVVSEVDKGSTFTVHLPIKEGG